MPDAPCQSLVGKDFAQKGHMQDAFSVNEALYAGKRSKPRTERRRAAFTRFPP
jgi:hypothetical protein